MASTKLAYAASGAFTITLASLTSSAAITGGRQSTAIANTGNLYLDYLIGGKITTGTSPTDATGIEVWAYAPVNDTPLYPDQFTGTDGDVTATSRGILFNSARLAASITIDSTSNRSYWFGPVSVASLFGVMPSHFGVFVVHNTSAALHATGGNHALYYRGVYSTTA